VDKRFIQKTKQYKINERNKQMKRQIRRSVFETNSSSTHSVSVSRKNNQRYSSNVLNVFIDEYDNKIHVRFGEFGWEIANYNFPYDKLQYIVTMLVETEGNNIASIDELFESDGFKLINDAIADYCHCDGIWIDEDMKLDSYEWNGKVHSYISHEGYIDHQSCEDYNSVQDFLDDYGLDIIQFIFDDGVIVHTDNDNH
jgi:hypothetical protein